MIGNTAYMITRSYFKVFNMQPIVGFFSRLLGRNWFSGETLLFAMLPLLTSNLIYLVFYFYFSPARTVFIMLLAVSCILGLFVHRYVFFLLLLAVFECDALVFTSFYFQMPVGMLLDSFRYASNLNAAQSLLYLAVAGTLAASFLVTYVTVRRLSFHRDRIRLAPFGLVLLALLGVDWWINLTPQKSVGLVSQFTESFVPIEDAASVHAKLEAHLDMPRQRNVLVVMVEGLGAFQSTAKQNLIWDPLLGDRIKQAYEVESGTTRYFGSTTSGEARELCNLKADYRDFRDRGQTDCLPQQAQEAGYRTAAFHAFTSDFFERGDWFPKIGFQELYFLENNAGLTPGQARRRCGSTFRGLCDPDVAKAVENYLADDTEEPKFVYWLTLNSHKPVQPGEAPARLSCETGGVFEDRELCLMSEQWLNVSHLVSEIALSGEIGATEILLVGDHHPPLFTRNGRRQFKQGKVAWLHLTPKSKAHTLTASAPEAASEL